MGHKFRLNNANIHSEINRKSRNTISILFVRNNTILRLTVTY